jgi:hypothetical protein
MAIRRKVIRRFIVDGKEYKSLEEMPDDIRRGIEKAMAKVTHTKLKPRIITSSSPIIVVKGKEYDSIEEMPPDIREIYEEVKEAIETDEMTDDAVSLAGEDITSKKLYSKAMSYSGPGPIGPQSSLLSFPRWVKTGLFLIAVIMALSFLIHINIVPRLLTFLEPSGDYQVYFYRDADGDGRGNHAEWILGKMGEEAPAGYTVIVGDCDDHDPNK